MCVCVCVCVCECVCVSSQNIFFPFKKVSVKPHVLHSDPRYKKEKCYISLYEPAV